MIVPPAGPSPRPARQVGHAGGGVRGAPRPDVTSDDLAPERQRWCRRHPAASSRRVRRAPVSVSRRASGATRRSRTQDGVMCAKLGVPASGNHNPQLAVEDVERRLDAGLPEGRTCSAPNPHGGRAAGQRPEDVVPRRKRPGSRPARGPDRPGSACGMCRRTRGRGAGRGACTMRLHRPGCRWCRPARGSRPSRHGAGAGRPDVLAGLAGRVRERHDVSAGVDRAGHLDLAARMEGGDRTAGRRRLGQCALSPKSDTDMSMRLMSTRRRTPSQYAA